MTAAAGLPPTAQAAATERTGVPIATVAQDATQAAYRVDGVQVDEARFYAVACDPRRSVVVEACAGAGKTWMLVSRILRALLEGSEPEQILAITFTRKAAGEMQARLDEWLQAFSAAASTPAHRELALRQRGLDVAQAERQALALGELRGRLLRLGRGVEVRTFHGWFAQLAGQLPLQLRSQLGLPADPQLVEDVSPLHNELFRRFQRRVHADPSLRADHDALIDRHRRHAVQTWLETAWHRGEELELADAAGVLDTSMPGPDSLDPRCAGVDHPLDLLRTPAVLTQWRELARALGQQKGAKARAAGEGLEQAAEWLTRGDPATAFARAWQALFTIKGEPRKGLGDLAGWQTLVDDLQALQLLCGQQQALDDHGRMVRLSRVLRSEYADLKRSRSLVDMADLERAALALLSDPDAAGWVLQRLDMRIQHVLIDEFQDTSPLQWHALFGWLSAYAGAGGGASGHRPPAVFIVGDPKQSIYRFRRAEPQVFEAAQRFVSDGLNGHVLACDHTRRNAPAVVAALNQVFGDAVRVDGWGPFRAHTTASVEPGSLQALPGVPRPERRAADAASAAGVWRDSLTQPRHEPDEHLKVVEARQVAAAIARLLAEDGLSPERVMVLSRQRAMLRRVADALAERGLSYVMPEALPLEDQPEALDVVALLDVLASPGHDLSLARALKSPLFACDDHDLTDLARRARPGRRAWIEALLAASPDVLSPALRRARDLLDRWGGQVQDLTPHELLDRVFHEGDLLARVLAVTPPPRRPVALQVLNGLLQAALEFEGGRFVSTYRFVRALRQGRLKVAPGTPAVAVQLLTVHGAKGLEADVVFMVDAAPERRRAERSTLLVDWPVASAVPRRAVFVGSESRMPAALQPLLAREIEERSREELNGLYVAMTRARRRLVVSHTEPHVAAPGRSWWQRLEPVTVALAADASPEPAQAIVPAEVPPAEVVRLPDLPRRDGVHDTAEGSDHGARHTAGPVLDGRAASLGRAVHRVLEWYGQPGTSLPLAGLPAAAGQAAAEFGLPPQAVAAISALAGSILGSPDSAPFFAGPALRWAGAEVPMTDQGQLLRLDRLVCLEVDGHPQWWVLDYKLSHRPGQLAGYREQLGQYRRAVRSALQAQGESDPDVRAAFITGAGVRVDL
jgi:ATP-dependent helicase/nuclease subunit A